MVMISLRSITVNENQTPSLTQHAMLVAWGQYLHCLGLIDKMEAVPLHQKTVTHRPQTKVLEFLAALLAGLPHLKDLSCAAHPVDQDQDVARAWGQPAWADHSGVSRTLTTLTMNEAVQLVSVLDQVSQPLIDREVVLAWQRRGELVLDADLTGRPVSNTSTSYPGAAYGHMGDAVHLGYQAAMVSMHSPTYGRLWLSVTPHPGDTVSSTQAEALVLAAEAKTGRRPKRRTELLKQRLQQTIRRQTCQVHRVARAQRALKEEQKRLQEAEKHVESWQKQVADYEAVYQAQEREERPQSKLAQARRKLGVQQRRQDRREQDLARGQRRLERCLSSLAECRAEIKRLEKRLKRFEWENAMNGAPLRVVLRMDAGFGTPENLTLLIEMGYEIYLKPYGRWAVAQLLKSQVTVKTLWTRVGKNAEMVAWRGFQVKDFPYLLDVALERFYTGKTQRHGVLIHYGDKPVTRDLPGWFHDYNGRQTIEAGIKEGKQVFTMHHLKVRAEPALYLQEHLATFAANLVRWAAHWLASQCPQLPEGWQDTIAPAVKEQVRVAAHTSAWVTWLEQGCLLTFSDHSVFAGRSLQIKRELAYQPVLPFAKSCVFSTI